MTRDRIAEIIKALLAKTVENGATDHEALAAAEKARELMAKYDLDLDEVERERMANEAFVNRRPRTSVADIIAPGVARYTLTRCWTQNGARTFSGRTSDVLFGTWLLDALDGFVNRKALEYAQTLPFCKPGLSKREWERVRLGLIEEFKRGAAVTINTRLVEMADATHGRAVIEARRSEIGRFVMESTGAQLVLSKGRRLAGGGDAYAAGAAAAKAATFHRPVNAGGGVRLLA